METERKPWLLRKGPSRSATIIRGKRRASGNQIENYLRIQFRYSGIQTFRFKNPSMYFMSKLEALRFRHWVRLRSQIYVHFGIPIPNSDPGFCGFGFRSVSVESDHQLIQYLISMISFRWIPDSGTDLAKNGIIPPLVHGRSLVVLTRPL